MLRGLYYVEFLCESLPRLQRYLEGYGLVPVAEEAHGRGVWMKGNTTVPLSIVIREATSKMDLAKLRRSGDCVTDIAFLVDNVDEVLKNIGAASKEVMDMNVSTKVGLKSNFRYVQLFFPRPGLRHTLIESDDFDFFPEGWMAPSEEIRNRSTGSHVPLVSFIDHIAIACLGGSLPSILRWYEIAFQLRQKTGIITIKTAEGDGLRLGSLYHIRDELNETFVKLTFVESVKVPGVKSDNQVTSFLKNHGGPGVQHLAFLAPDIFRARRELASEGVQFLAAPPGYYELPRMIAQADAAGIELSKLAQGGILFDNEPENMQLDDPDAGSKYLLQVFTRSPFPHDTCFFELITRGNHREGFGAGNIRNLFLAVALEKKRKAREARRQRAAMMQSSESQAPGPDGGLLSDRSIGKNALPEPDSPVLERHGDEDAIAQAHTTPTVVIGATVCGLVLALSLAQANIKTVLIGREPVAPTEEARFHLMGPMSHNIWRRLGIWEDVQKIMTPLSTVEVWNGMDGSHKEYPQDCMYLPTDELREILLRKLDNVSELCEVRLGHEVVALGEVEGRMAVHVEPPGPLLAEYVICAEGRSSFWSSHLLAGNHLDLDDLVSVNLSSSNPAIPAIQNLQVWMNPWVDSESMVAVPLRDGSIQVVFPAAETIQDLSDYEDDVLDDEENSEEEQQGQSRSANGNNKNNDDDDDDALTTTEDQMSTMTSTTVTERHREQRVRTKHASRIANFCSLLGLDKGLGLEEEMQSLVELQMQGDEIARCAKKELQHCKQSELLVVGLDIAAEQIEETQRRISHWWSPAVTLPNTALRAINRTVERRKGKAEELSKKYVSAVAKLEQEMREVEEKMALIRRVIVKRKSVLINSVEEFDVKSASFLSRAVTGRMIFLPTNNCVTSIFNFKLNEALMDVSSLVWRMEAIVKKGVSAAGLLAQYEEERMLAAQVRLHQKQYILRFFSPGPLLALRDAVQEVGVDAFSLQEFLKPANLAVADSAIRDWSSSLLPASRDFFIDCPVICAGFQTMLSDCLPSSPSFVLLCFGCTAPLDLSEGIVPILICETDASDCSSCESGGALVLHAVDAPVNIWKKYQASEGTMVLLRPDWIVQLRCAQWSVAVGAMMTQVYVGPAVLSQLPPKVPVWDSLSFQSSIYWLLYDALLNVKVDRVELLQRVLSGLGRGSDILDQKLEESKDETIVKTSEASIETDDAPQITGAPTSDREETELAKVLISRCISQNIEIFELEDLVARALQELNTIKVRKTSLKTTNRTSSRASSSRASPRASISVSISEEADSVLFPDD